MTFQIFISENIQKYSYENFKPCQLLECPRYASKGNIEGNWSKNKLVYM